MGIIFTFYIVKTNGEKERENWKERIKSIEQSGIHACKYIHN